MSGLVTAQIRCDAMPDGPDWPPCMTPAEIDGVGTLTLLRSLLREQGWHRTKGGRDICPACWAEGHR